MGPAHSHRDPIPYPLGEQLGANLAGWASLFVMPVNNVCYIFFSEAMWQRVWASVDRSTLRKGAVLGAAVTVMIVFLSGFGGWLAIAAGRVTPDTNENVYMIQVRMISCNSHTQPISCWHEAASRCSSCVDALGHGYGSNVSFQPCPA